MGSVRRCAIIAVALAGLGFVAPPAGAQQEFTLTVPVRPANLPQTARVKIAFESAAIGAGPQVIIDGGAPIALATPCSVNPATCNALGSFGPGNGDTAQVKWVSPTRLEVNLTFTTDFGSNLCDSTRVSNRSVMLKLSSAVAATGYRMAGYTVPEKPTTLNPAPKCDVAFRRGGAPTASLSVVPGVSNLGRLPLDVVLVLDKSGSMGWALPGASSGETRWQRLDSSVGQFMNLWKQAVAAGVEGSADDRIGLVFFNHLPEDALLDASSIFKSRGVAGWDAPAPANNIITAQVASRSPGGATSIGGGIQEAKLRLGGLVGSAPNDATIVVFTDGEQNTPPMIAGDPLPTDPLKVNGVRLMDYSLPVLTIGLGASTGPFADLLDRIAHETAGHSKITTNALTLDTVFTDQLVAALKGNTLSLVARRLEQLPVPGAGTPLTPFVDSSVKRMIFVVGWEGLQSPRAVRLEIRDPNGALVNPVVTGQGDFYRVASVDIPGSGPTGQWQAQVLPDAAHAPLRYHVSAYAVEGRLDYRFTVKSGPVGTGQPVVVRAEIAYDGRPLDNVPAGGLRVTVERPGENLGNILATPASSGDQQSEASQRQSAVSAKIDQLAKTQRLLDRIEPQALPTVLNMTDLGGGVYEAAFDQTVVGGQYRFRVEMDWNDPRTGRIRRVEVVERQVPVLPTAAATQVQEQRNIAAGTAQVSIILKDGFGNLVGPGYAPLFSVQATPPANVGAITDPSGTGTYVIPISGVPGGTDPRITITYRGQVVRDALLSKVTQRPCVDRRWPWWLRPLSYLCKCAHR